MISVSDKFVSIMNSNIRPKTNFKITVSDSNNTFEWTAKDITNFTFKRGIDPVGRNLPFLELVWEEIYIGELNTANEATKYNNISPYMKVELTIEQSLSFINTWQDIYKYTWNELFDSGFTWRDVLRKVETETIKMPTMFLVAKPEVENQKIRWVARDFLYFLDIPQEIGFEANLPFRNPLRYFLLDERANFKNNNDMISVIFRSDANLLDDFAPIDFLMEDMTLFNGTTKNILKDYLASAGCFWTFVEDGSITPMTMITFVYSPYPFYFGANIIKNYPKITKGKNISSFSFIQNKVKLDEANKYVLSTPDEVIPVTASTSVNKFFYKDFGKVEINDSNSGSFPPKTINKTILTNLQNLTIIPVSLNSTEIFLNNEKQGEQYTENNSCNFFGVEHDSFKLRKNSLNTWFSENKYTLEFEGLPVFHIEPYDMVKVATNLFNDGQQINKTGFVLEQHLTFNGAFSQKTIVREV